MYNGIGGAIAVVDALKLAGHDLTREGFINALNQTAALKTGVLSVPITFTATEHAGVSSGGMMTMIGGKTELVTSWPVGK